MSEKWDQALIAKLSDDIEELEDLHLPDIAVRVKAAVAALESVSPRLVTSEDELAELDEMTLVRIDYKLRDKHKKVAHVWHFLVSGRDTGGAASGQAEVVGRGRLPKVWSTYEPLDGVFTVLWSPAPEGSPE